MMLFIVEHAGPSGGVISSILTGVHGCIFVSGCGGTEALAGGYHVTFWCGDGIRVMFRDAICSEARPRGEISRVDGSKPG